MHQIIHSVSQHGYLFLFAWVLADQLGLPIPAIPALLAAGVLSGMGKLSFPACVGLGLLACVIGDLVWFMLGRKYGGKIINLLCRISLEPDTCVRKSSGVFDKHGAASLLLAKFVPGVGTVAIPMAGNSRMNFRTFALYDLGGCILYVLSLMGIGLALSNSIERLESLTAYSSSLGYWLVVLAAIGLLGFRIYQRQKFLHDLRMSRIAPEELLAMLNTGKEPFVVDLRHALDFLPNSQVIPTAMRIDPDELVKQVMAIPRDRDIILYCT